MTLPALLALLALLALDAATPLRAQNARERFVVDRWSTDEGLPQNTISDITQSRDGYLWLATFGGLVRFDGLHFTLFSSARYPGLRADRVLSLAVDSAGALWIGTESGLSRYAHGEFTAFGSTHGLGDDGVSVITTDARGRLWVGLLQTGLVRLDGERFTRFGARDGLILTSVNRIHEDAAGRMWVSHYDEQCLLDRDAIRFRCGQSVGPAPGSWHAVGRDATGEGEGIWFTSAGRVARLGRNGMERSTVAFGGGVGVTTADSNGVLTSARGYLMYARGADRRVDTLPLPDGRKLFGVRSMFVDRENVIWVGTDADGLLRLRPRVFRVFTATDGLSSDHPTATLSDNRGQLWIGSNCGTLNVMAGDRITAFKPRAGGGAPVFCPWSLARDSSGVIWAGTYGDGLARIENGTVTWYTTASGLSENSVVALLVDRAGAVWAGTVGRGLNRIEHGRISRYDTSAGLASGSIRHIYEDRSGTLWIGTLGGLSKRVVGSERFVSFTTADGLPSNHVRAVYEDADGVVWIGTYGGGLARLKNGRFATINSAAGLPEDVVSAILEDDDHNLWMTGNQGVFRVSRRELDAFADGVARSVHAVAYGRADGLLSAETNGGFQPAASRDARGRMWFPTMRGLAMLEPGVAGVNRVPPGIALEELRIDGVPRPLVDGTDIPAAARNLELTYAALTTSAPEHVTYRYRLEGLDDRWLDVGARRTAYFSALPAGSYTFRVSAANRDGVWNAAGATLRFRVLPPLWQTWWFRSLSAAMLLGLAGGALQLRFMRLREQQERQRTFSRRYIDGQETERKRIAAELHDGVGQGLLVVKTRAAMALRSPDMGDAARAHFDAIASIATDTLEDARRLSHNLRPHELDRLGLAAAIHAAAEHATDGDRLVVDVVADGIDRALSPDAEIGLYRIVQETLNNAMKHAAATRVTIVARRVGAQIEMIVKDNGRGFVPTERTGFGLSGMEERLRLLGGSLTIRSAPGAGTTIEVLVPVQPGAPGATGRS